MITNNKYKGIIFIIISAFCFALMNMFVRLSGDLPTAEKGFFRNFVAFVFALVIMIKDRESFHFQKRNLPLLIGRSLMGTLGILGNFYAVSNMSSLGDASILNKMSPFFAVLFSLIFLKERLKNVPGARPYRRVYRRNIRYKTNLRERGAVSVAVRIVRRNSRWRGIFYGSSARNKGRERQLYCSVFLGIQLYNDDTYDVI